MSMLAMAIAIAPSLGQIYHFDREVRKCYRPAHLGTCSGKDLDYGCRPITIAYDGPPMPELNCTDINRPHTPSWTGKGFKPALPSQCLPRGACNSDENVQVLLDLWERMQTCWHCNLMGEDVSNVIENKLRMRFLFKTVYTNGMMLFEFPPTTILHRFDMDTLYSLDICPIAFLVGIYALMMYRPRPANDYQFMVLYQEAIIMRELNNLLLRECGGDVFRDYLFDTMHISPTQIEYVAESIITGLAAKRDVTAPRPFTNATRLKPWHFEIMDLGSQRGSDSLYYVHQGYRVVAVDAHPHSAADIREHFGPVLADGTLQFHNIAIADCTMGDCSSAAKSVHFCLHRVPAHSYVLCDPEVSDCTGKHTWANCDHHARNKKEEKPKEPYVVPAFTCRNLFKSLGLPTLYLKIDVESVDIQCVAALQQMVHAGRVKLPKYISIELKPENNVNMSTRMLKDLGYRGFKIAQQRYYCPHSSRFKFFKIFKLQIKP